MEKDNVNEDFEDFFIKKLLKKKYKNKDKQTAESNDNRLSRKATSPIGILEKRNPRKIKSG